MLHVQSIQDQSLRAARIATAGAFFFDGVTFATWVTRIPVIQEHLQLSNAVLGGVLLMMSLGAVIMMPLMGRLVARYGSRYGVSCAVASFGATLVLPSLAVGTISLGIALLIVGAGFGAVNVSINAQAVTVERAYARPIMASFHAMFSLGGIAGAIIGSIAAGRGMSPSVHFSVMGATTIAGALIISRFLLSDSDVVVAPNQTRPRFHNFAFLGALACCSACGEGAMADWSAVFLRQVSHANAARAALGFAAFSACMTLGRLVADYVTRAIGPVQTIRAGGSLAAAGLLVAMMFPGTFTAITGFAMVGAGLSALIPTIFSAAGRMPGVAPSVAIAAVSTTGYFGFLCGPPLIGVAAEAVTLRWAIGIVFVACCAAAALARNVAPQNIDAKNKAGDTGTENPPVAGSDPLTSPGQVALAFRRSA